jgi:eukaryotic-like serine/threonine-protein kinase
MSGDTMLGRRLNEYLLERLLGQGGMARVYRGLDMNLQRYVAVKVIDTPYRHDSEYNQRFEREAQAIAQLDHPHIVRLYRYGEQDGLLYMVMQYIEGSDLETIMGQYEADGESMERDDICRLVREVCRALDYAHGRYVIHRDVKPANIMLDMAGRAVVADFGLALLTDLGTRGEVFGSPHYIAPEQAISSAAAVPQTDLYALGVILYRMFTGVLPFEGNDPLEVALRHVSEAPAPPRSLRPEISPQLEAVILKALAKEPGNRYASGQALAGALAAVLDDDKLPVSPATPSTRLTIAERVSLGLEPLPPPPAAVALPAAAVAQPAAPAAMAERPTASIPAARVATPPAPGAAIAAGAQAQPAPVVVTRALLSALPDVNRRALLVVAAIVALGLLSLGCLVTTGLLLVRAGILFPAPMALTVTPMVTAGSSTAPDAAAELVTPTVAATPTPPEPAPAAEVTPVPTPVAVWLPLILNDFGEEP